jgi:hypothetical protein
MSYLVELILSRFISLIEKWPPQTNLVIYVRILNPGIHPDHYTAILAQALGDNFGLLAGALLDQLARQADAEQFAQLLGQLADQLASQSG